MTEFRVGTCSWADRSLRSSGWYPARAGESATRLEYYSQFFNTVEVDSAYYAIPDEDRFYHWAAHTPGDFVFNVKSYGLFTHHRVQVSTLPAPARSLFPAEMSGKRVALDDIPREARRKVWDLFRERVMILHGMKRLGYLLFQFPPWVRFDETHLRYFRRISDLAAPIRVAIEIRHRSWLEGRNRDRFLGLLKDENMALVAADEPQLEWTPPFHWELTASWGGVIRLHGKNTEAWKNPGATVEERFRYLYSEEELKQLRGTITDMKGSAERVYIMFNNCFRDHSVKNALRMRELLGLAHKDGIPEQKALQLEEDTLFI